MKIPVAEAAARLNIHPAEFVFLLAGIAAPFDELYPSVDEGFVDTIRSMHPEIFSRSSDRPLHEIEPTRGDKDQREFRLSAESERVVSALYHKRHWGSNTVSEPTLRNHYCRGLRDFDSAIRELARARLLWTDSLRGPFSLNTRAKAQIVEIVERTSKSALAS